MKRKIFGIFVAGGSGVRMGTKTPKQFLEIDGKPILQRTIESFLDAEPDMKVITVLPEDHFDTWNELCLKNSFNISQILVKGGITRFHSVRNALAKVPDGAIVAIQDGVRPFAGRNLLCTMFGRAEEVPALVPVRPVTDTLKSLRKTEKGLESVEGAKDPDRSLVFAAQTPQIFWSEEIKSAYSAAFDTSFTDDASVYAKSGKPLSWIEGERFNIKITTPEDLELAEFISARLTSSL